MRDGAKPKRTCLLEGFYGLESGFSLDRESNVMAVVCQKQVVLIAFELREDRIHFEVKIRRSLGEGQCRIFSSKCIYWGYAGVSVTVSAVFQDQMYFYLYAVTEVTQEYRWRSVAYFRTKYIFICMQLPRLRTRIGEGQWHISGPNIFYLYAITEVSVCNAFKIK